MSLHENIQLLHFGKDERINKTKIIHSKSMRLRLLVLLLRLFIIINIRSR